MAVVLGTNAGFVTVAPTVDPDGDAGTCDNYSTAHKDTSPATAARIIEIGWWCDAATEESNFELGLYSHNAGSNKPATRLYVANTNAKGTGTGWLKATVDWGIDPNTVYWLAMQLDNTATASKIDASGLGRTSVVVASTLAATWEAGSSEATLTKAIYAVWDTGTEYVDMAGIIVGTSSLSGTLTISYIIDIAGTVTGVSSVGGVLGAELILSPNWQVDTFKNIKRLIVIGNDSLYFEDI